MPLEPCPQISLAAIELEDSRLGPLALLVDDADDLRRPGYGEIVDGQPRTDFDGRSVDDLADLGNGQGFVLDRPGRQVLAAPQIERRDILHIHAELQHPLNGREVVVDCLVGEAALLHGLFEQLQILDANVASMGGAVLVQESLQVLAVVRSDEQGFVISAGLFGGDELLDKGQDGDSFGRQDGQCCGAVGLPLPPDLQHFDVLLHRLVGIAAEPPAFSHRPGLEATVWNLGELGRFGVHNGRKSTSSRHSRQSWRHSSFRKPLCRISPSRTRTYDLAVNSRFSSCVSSRISAIWSFLCRLMAARSWRPAEPQPTLPLGGADVAPKETL